MLASILIFSGGFAMGAGIVMITMDKQYMGEVSWAGPIEIIVGCIFLAVALFG